MGGITLPMLERLGYPIPPFDFRVPGVTSMSVDLHKYGYTAKGASVILHRNRELRRHQTFATDNWLGGLYASSGILGTQERRPDRRGVGGDELSRRRRLPAPDQDGARRRPKPCSPGCAPFPASRVLGEPDATLAAFTFDDVDAFAVGKALAQRGWFVDQQKPPPSLHCTVNAVHAPVIAEFLTALRECIKEARAAQATARQAAYGTLE